MNRFIAHADRSIRKLRNILRRLPEHPSIEAVHGLRSHARRFETIAATLHLVRGHRARHLLAAIKAIRKAAGAVRDMDVLSLDALDLTGQCAEKSVLRLLHHLHFKRIHKANVLAQLVARHRKSLCAALKHFSRSVKKLEEPHQAKNREPAIARTQDAAAVIDLYLELRLWPRFTAENLHSFRLKIKSLRILLQMEEGDNSSIFADLGTTKDLIGDWHDWHQLLKIAENALALPEDRPAIQRVREIAQKKLAAGIAGAEDLLARYVAFNSPRRAA